MGKIYGYKNMIWREKGNKWHYGNDFINFLKREAANGVSLKNLKDEIGIDYKVLKNILNKEDIKLKINKKNSNFKAIYQDYDWCYQKYIIEGMNHAEMAQEAKCTKRVIEKWCSERHRLTQAYRKENKKLSSMQRDLLIGSLLGDGHIDKRDTQPIFIVSHAENQKDYLFWKYDIIKDFCNIPPTYYSDRLIKHFEGGIYNAQPYYRISTRIHDCFKEIRSMTVIDLISNLNEFSLCIHILDDGSRNNSNWNTCVAPYSEEEKQYFLRELNDKFGLEAYMRESDNRYIYFTSKSSRDIDNIILRNIPNNLDIVKYKIIDNNITKQSNYRMVETDNGLVGLARFCRNNKISNTKKNKNYMKMVDIFDSGITKSNDMLEIYYGGN